MKPNRILLASLAMSALSAHAQVTMNVDVSHPGITVSPDLYGIFFEDINHAADGGLYAELIRNRSFEDNDKTPESWSKYVSPGAVMDMKLVTTKLLNAAQGRALELNIKATPSAPVCLVNEGFWGINAVQGRKYQLTFFAKGKYKGTLRATLCDKEGKKLYADVPIQGKITGNWTKFTAELTSNGNDAKAQFALVADGKGVLDLDVISLFPPTFKNRPNGMRPDLAQMLAQLRPKFMRFPGGCFVEGQDSPDNAFHWEKTIGPIETRPGHQNVNWRYRTSDGMGFHDMLQLSEDLGAKPLYVVNVGLWHGGLTPVDSIQPWIDECMNALEYANGPVTSKYGALRAQNGHPEPFNIEYLEIGNENNQPVASQQSDHYYDRYKKFKDAVLAKYPKMHLIGNVVAWGDDNPKWGSNESVELLDEHYYRNPAWFANQFKKYDSYERGKHQVYVGEYAVTSGFGKDGNLDAALGEAVYMMGIENNADVVKLASYAPIFANVHDRMWSPDMIQFDGTHAYGTPSYYVQKVMAENVGTRKLNVTVENPYEEENQTLLKPETCQVGAATWDTQASFKFDGVVGDGSEKIAKGMPNDYAQVKGEWTRDDNELTQRSNAEGAIAVLNDKVTAKEYTYHVKARKNSGREGFMVVFNYVDDKNYCWANFGGWANSQHGMEQVVDGHKAQLGTVKGSVETGRWYDVDIHVKGDSIYASLDGKQVFATRMQANTLPGLFTTAAVDDKSGEVVVKIANTGSHATTAKVNLNGASARDARVIRLSSAQGTDENNLQNPTRIYPVTELLSADQNSVEVEVPAYSLNIVRIKK